jgi:hypothetical protein
VFPVRYELNSYIVFRKRLVSKRLSMSILLKCTQLYKYTFLLCTSTSIALLRLNHGPFRTRQLAGQRCKRLKVASGLLSFWISFTVQDFKYTMFRKLYLFPSSGEGVGDTYSVGSLRKSQPQSLGI